MVPRGAWKTLGLEHPPRNAGREAHKAYSKNLVLFNQLIQNKIGVNLQQPPIQVGNSIWFDMVTTYNLWYNLLSKHQITASKITCVIKTRVNSLNQPTMIRFTTRTPMSMGALILTIFRAIWKKFPTLLACGYNRT